MKTAAEIWIDFKKAADLADKLDSIAGEMDNARDDQFIPYINEVNGAWSGENADNYITKGDGIKLNIESNAKNVRMVAKTIRIIAKNIYDAEMASIAIAED